MLLTEDGVLRISDLGISKLSPTPMKGTSENVSISNTFCHGTDGYRAPEIKGDKKDNSNSQPYTNMVDVYSLGKSIQHMIDRVYDVFHISLYIAKIFRRPGVAMTKERKAVSVSEPLIKLYDR